MTSDTGNDIGLRLRAALRPTLGSEVDTLDGDVELVDALGERYDSLAALECVSQVEDAFGFEVDFVAHDVRFWFSTLNRMERFVAEALEDQRELTRGA